MRITLFIILTFFFATVGISQEKFTGNYEPIIGLEYDLNEIYSHEFSIEGRINWYDEKDYNFHVKQLDLAHFSSLKLNDNNKLALGVQYRFEENFGGNDQNELRFTEEYKYIISRGITKLKHRVRLEQRFAGSLTSHRFRYKFGISQPLNPNMNDGNGIYLSASLESLLTVSNAFRPEYEQRISGGIGWPLTKHAELDLGIQYRLDDFTQNLGHELFFVTGLNFKI